MNDITAISTVIKTHKKLLLFFGAFFLIIFLCFLVLLEGFTISHLKFGDNIRIEKLYLKWNNRFYIQASLVDLSGLKDDEKPLDLTPLKQLPTYIQWIEEWTNTIKIETIRYDDITASIHYTKNQTGTLKLQKGKVALAGNFTLTPNVFQANLSTPKSNFIYGDGNITVDIPHQKFKIASSLSVPDAPTLYVLAIGDTQKISLSLNAATSFKRLDTLINAIGIDPDVRPWLTTHLGFNEAILQKCNIDLNYDEDPLRKIIIRASVHDVAYSFAQGISPIRASDVYLNFHDGKLFITPINATFQMLPLEKSTLNLDFTTPDEILNIHILTGHAQLNDSIIELLNHYNIVLPLRQNNGFIATDFTFHLNLSTLNSEAKGVFIPGPSTFILDKKPFQTRGGKVTLQNSKVTFSGFTVMHPQYGEGKVSGNFNGTDHTGKIQISPTRLTPQKEISLLSSASVITLHLSPKKNTLEVSPTQWKAFDEIIHFGGFKTLVDFTKSSFTLPAIPFKIPNKVHGNFQGKLTGDTMHLALVLDQLNLFDIQLKSPPLHLIADTKGMNFNITSKQASTWNVDGKKLILSPFSLQTHQSTAAIQNTRLSIDGLLASSINGTYNWQTKIGRFNLDNIVLMDPKISHYASFKTPQTLNIDFSKKIPNFSLDKLATTIQHSDKNWAITIENLTAYQNFVPLLKQYNLTNGNLSLLYAPDTQTVAFNGTLKYPYKLLIIDNKMTSKYTFAGTYRNDTLTIDLNNYLHATYNDSLDLKMKNCGINLPEVLRWIDNLPNTEKKTSPTSDDETTITFNGQNTYIRLNDERRILSDSITGTLNGDDGYATLKHADGLAKMTMKDGLFYLDGTNFNSQFMENLYAQSDLVGGKLSFTLKYQNEITEGLIRIEKVTLKQFKLLSNILAFTNTLSTLTSFSLPNYNQKGLFANEIYTHFNYQHDTVDVDTFVINSPETQISGDLKANIEKDTIKGTMTLKSNTGTTIGKIPIVGYILFGKDGSLSTTVDLSGKFSDPTINTGVAKELVAAPYNILKRTVISPFRWVSPSKDQ
jgi:hypothetical protein